MPVRRSQLVESVRAKRLPPPAVARAILAAAEVSQGNVADELGVHRVTVARWLAGTRTPRGEVRERYARLLRELEGEVAS